MSAKVHMPATSCATCGAPLPHRAPSKRTGYAYCSQRCYKSSEHRAELTRQMVKKRSPGGRVTLTCDQCGEEFTRQRHAVKPAANYCTHSCYALSKRAPDGRQINRLGYALIHVGKGVPGATKSGHVLEHRWVMQQLIGRPLLSSENVHHRNGDRADNRLENLELWTKSQPPGQRVVDKLAWARQILALYEDTPLF